MFQLALHLFRFDRIRWLLFVTGASCVLILALATPARLWPLLLIYFLAAVYNEFNGPKRGRVYRSLPLCRDTVEKGLWTGMVVALPLLWAVLALPFVVFGAIDFSEILFLVALVGTCTSCVTYVHEIERLWHERVRTSERFFSPRMKCWLPSIALLAALVVFMYHPDSGAAKVDWVHLVLFAMGGFFLVFTYRHRRYLWKDLMKRKVGDEGPASAVRSPIVFPSRHWCRLVEWNEQWFLNTVGMTVILMASILIRYGVRVFGRDPWEYRHWAGAVAGYTSFLLLASVLEKQATGLRAYRMLPIQARALSARFVYQHAVNFAMLLIPVCLFAPAALGVSISDVLIISWAGFGTWLALCGLILLLGSVTPSGSVGTAGAIIMLELLFLASSIHTGAAFAGIALTIAGIVFYYLAITRSSRAYQARKGSVLDALEKE